MSLPYSAHLAKPQRNFLPVNFKVDQWENLEPYYKNLSERDLLSVVDLEHWLKDISELEAAISEDACWRQIKMTCDTENETYKNDFEFFCRAIQPNIQPWEDVLNKKFINCTYTKDLPQEQYGTYIRAVAQNIKLFTEKNIPIQSELSIQQQEYGAITGAMSVTLNEKEYTLQQAAKFLEDEDRTQREKVYVAINERRLKDKEALNNLFNDLIAKRIQLATNAGFANYIDYRFAELGRFDYTPKDCFQFHEGIQQHVLPIVNKIYAAKKESLQLSDLRPYDIDATPKGEKPLRPFEHTEALYEKSVSCFESLDPFFANCLRTMKAMGHFDLESRKGKAPGGYNCPLAESGAPFIFMNAAGQMSDVTTMVHEGGHAIHSFLAHELSLNAFKNYPMEIAEVASMAMELFSMENWDKFFTDKNELKKAKLHQLERVITIFPWIATIDKFQFWLYENPKHTEDERNEAWLNIANEFASNEINYEGLGHYRKYQWQKQLHLYEVPFYYIEYGIAQLGAIGMWKQFKANKEQALKNYCSALALGGTKTLPELYKTAGIEFNFSATYIKELMQFVATEIETISNN
jgi:oligoendopeptidase F